MKKILITVCAFLAMTSLAFAANSVGVPVTSEGVPQFAECTKAGGITLEFDDGTVFASGDEITFDLPLNVELCKSFDFIIGTGIANGDPAVYNNAFLMPAVGTDNAGPLTGDGSFINATGAGAVAGVAFRLVGNSGQQRITLSVLGDHDADGTLTTDAGSSLEFDAPAANPDGLLVIEILDQTLHPVVGNSGMFSDSDSDGWYDDRTTSNENSLCINLINYQGEFVKLGVDSKDDKYTFTPSDPQVAHIITSEGYALQAQDKQVKGRIIESDSTTAGQNDEVTTFTCSVINNESNSPHNTADSETLADWAAEADGFCEETHRNNKLIIQRTDGLAFTSSSRYQVSLEILVDGNDGDQGVYFDGQIGADGFTNFTDASTAALPATARATVYFNAQNNANVADPDADGVDATIALAGGETGCSIDAENRIVKAQTQESTLGLNGTSDDFLWIDIPNMVWDRTLFTEGEVLSVRVILKEGGCNVLITEEFVIGTLGCEDSASSCTVFGQVYPYFAKDGNYANVLVITNTSSSSTDFSIEIYEKDGDKWTASATIDGESMGVYLVHDQLTVTGDADNAAGAVFGDSQAYIVVSAVGSSSFYGAAFVTNAANGASFSQSPSDVAAMGSVVCP